MFGTNTVSKSNVLKHVIGEVGFKNFREIKRSKRYGNVRFYSRKLTLNPSKTSIFQRNNITERIFAFRYNSNQATIQPKKENDPETKNYFQDLLHARKMQAQRSVLVEVMKKEDIPYAVGHCEKYGSIENAFTYSGERENCFLLLEFSNENATKELFSNCTCKNIADAFPVCSRLIGYEKKFDSKMSNININEESIPSSFLKPTASVSDVIQTIYVTEKLTELETRLRYFYCTLLRDFLSGIFPYCDALPFGSSVNGIGKHGCDLDVMIRLYPEQVNGNGELSFLNKTCVGNRKNFQQKSVACVGDMIRTVLPGISYVERIMHARVPILKMKNRILNIDCDLSVNNLSAVYMSNVIHFLGEIDDRVRPLMFAVKQWAKEAKITDSSAGSWISNFGLINLVIFFLQNRSQPILPPLNDAIAIIGEDDSFNFQVQYLKSIEELKSFASINDESLAVLLKEFLSFLTTETFEENIISFMTGTKRARHCEMGIPMWMQYPFDEALNITKNVSFSEFKNMREKARISHKCLENNLKHNVNTITDFSILLGIPSASRIGLKSQKVDVSSIIEDNKIYKNKMNKRRTL